MLSPMIRLAGLPLVIIAVFSLAGGHWAVLQSVAWTGMILSYSKEAGLPAAIEKTFSNRAPCKLCKAISAGKQKEGRTQTIASDAKKIDQLSGPRGSSAPLPPATGFSYPPNPSVAAKARSTAPPTPVPIAA